jgi:hypothetical protein
MNTEHGKKIFFFDRSEKRSGPIQADVAHAGEKVTFCCDKEFVIFFKSETSKYIEPGETRFLSRDNGEGLHTIEITFTKTRLPDEGLDYSVITANGLLDPRFVPPRR